MEKDIFMDFINQESLQLYKIICETSFLSIKENYEKKLGGGHQSNF